MVTDRPCMQGEWGTTARESGVERERRREFVESHVFAFRSEFVVLRDSFKVCGFGT